MLRLESITKTFNANGMEVHALRDVTAEFAPGTFSVIQGPSGSGKSTALLIMGAMLRPTSGRVIVNTNQTTANHETNNTSQTKPVIARNEQSEGRGNLPTTGMRNTQVQSQSFGDKIRTTNTNQTNPVIARSEQSERRGNLPTSDARTSQLNVDLYSLTSAERAKFRAQSMGFVFQMFHLLPYLDVRSNVLTAHSDRDAKSKRDHAEALLSDLGLSHRARHRPSQLSAGERQRTAIARALMNDPAIILADEPTGNLDPDNAHIIMARLAQFRDAGGTVIVVTHGADADQFADTHYRLQNGELQTAEPAAAT